MSEIGSHNFDASPRMGKVIAFIDSEVARTKRFPTRKAIAEHIGAPNTGIITDILHRLTNRGLLVRKWQRDGFIWRMPPQEDLRRRGSDVGRPVALDIGKARHE